ncbi:MAG: 4-hydroxythreonine-4-phosphate dehydrogenase PdxA [Spirochaetales bacterium]|nr:4-hydroxythreonine-4-phosphate dehydrogenase PdxA [Spirochaetales bacterium]
MNRPFIAVPIGDPAGIGPEIVVKAVASEEIKNIARCIIIGDCNVIANALKITNTDINICRIEKTEDYKDNHLNIIPIDNVDFTALHIGEVSGICGKAAYEYIEKSIDLAIKKQVAAVATPPINKESLKAANIPYIGHTEIFGALTNTADPLTMFEVRNLRIFFLTRHVSLRNACDLITKERIEDYVKRCIDVLNKLGVTDGTMAIAGLNPHSGEHGLFGLEEVDEITPAVENLKALGYEVDGPISADSVFHLALQGRYNSVLSLYHDQGHIAAKTFDFERTISVTGGMPILRTSVDHGTAMDIAGTGKASEISMKEAIKVAVKYCNSYI